MSACQTGQKPLCESKPNLEEGLPHLAELEQRNIQTESLSFENEPRV
jgi:hypothetical protein